MSKPKLRTVSGARSLALALVIALVASLLAIPAYAQVPSGASGSVDKVDLSPIWIFDADEELYKFVVEEDDLRGYSKGNELIEIVFDGQVIPDGSLTVCEVLTFRVLQLAFSQLWPDDVPNLADFAVRYGDPGESSKATFEYITRAFSRGEAQIEMAEGVTEQNLDVDAFWYEFTNTDTEESFETQVLEGVYPEGFFELRTKVRMGEATEAEKADFASQWEEVRDNLLTWELDDLFEVEEEQAEPAPVWQLVFALGLTSIVVGTTVYSLARRGKK
ncbi:MAG: hypothetical protein E3J81_01190 [Dehalococcoidia bacterium]|nr:MAG: hypothetical protein E3J81_01190 [Dehalococcoidia bacterium]